MWSIWMFGVKIVGLGERCRVLPGRSDGWEESMNAVRLRKENNRSDEECGENTACLWSDCGRQRWIAAVRDRRMRSRCVFIRKDHGRNHDWWICLR